MGLARTIAFFFCIQLVAGGDDYVYVTIPSGKIRGTVSSTEVAPGVFSQVGTFLGVPYAKPPVGDLRFKRTVLPDPFEDTLHADKMPAACLQYSEYLFPWYDDQPGQSEDCLYLNIWAPMNVNRSSSPVKVFIQGGGWFTYGSTRQGYYNAHDDALDLEDEQNKGVVVVTVNYRLGALGFLTSGTDDAPGNAALYDIITAIEWVNKNIAAFGGDPNQVTLMGQGAGGKAVSLFFTTPRSKGLFARAILTGASFYTLKGDSYDNNIKLAGKLAKALGCTTDIYQDPAATTKFLKDVEGPRLVKVLSSFSPVFQEPPNAFLPNFQHDDLIVNNPGQAFQAGDFPYFELIVAFTKDEGDFFLTLNNPDVFGVFGQKDVGINASQAMTIAKNFLTGYPDDVIKQLLGDLDEGVTTDNRKKLYEAMGAEAIYCPEVYIAEKVADEGYPVYMIEKNVFPPYNPWSSWMGSVHFNNIESEFYIREGPLTVHGKSYDFTPQQRGVSLSTKKLQSQFFYTGKLDRVLYNTQSREYSTIDQTQSDFEGANYYNITQGKCEILRPYFIH